MTFIIAEIGSNWTSFEDAKDSITMAKNCGADAVKFQLYTHEELYGIPGSPPTIINGVPTSEFDTMPGQLPKDWLPKLKEKADACGIELMCTAFSPEGLKYVDQFVKRHKIASAELTYRELLEAAKATGKPILLSTGGSSLTDISMALRYIKPNLTLNQYEKSGGRLQDYTPHVRGPGDVTLMYCVSAYPAKNVNLFSIDQLRKSFPGLPIGYSCHTDEWYTPVCAVRYHHAKVIEKHFKLRDMDTPDSPHSLNPEQFKEMVDVIRGKADHICFPEPQERDMLTRHNRRLIATKDIAPQDVFKYSENFGSFRSLREDVEGLHGFADQSVNGKTCKVALKAGDPITPRHVE